MATTQLATLGSSNVVEETIAGLQRVRHKLEHCIALRQRSGILSELNVYVLDLLKKKYLRTATKLYTLVSFSHLDIQTHESISEKLNLRVAVLKSLFHGKSRAILTRNIERDQLHLETSQLLLNITQCRADLVATRIDHSRQQKSLKDKIHRLKLRNATKSEHFSQDTALSKGAIRASVHRKVAGIYKAKIKAVVMNQQQQCKQIEDNMREDVNVFLNNMDEKYKQEIRQKSAGR